MRRVDPSASATSAEPGKQALDELELFDDCPVVVLLFVSDVVPSVGLGDKDGVGVADRFGASPVRRQAQPVEDAMRVPLLRSTTLRTSTNGLSRSSLLKNNNRGAFNVERVFLEMIT